MEQADVDLISNLARQHRLSAAWKLKASSAFAKADPEHKDLIRFSQEDQVDIFNELIGGGASLTSPIPRESTSASWWWPASWLRPAAPLGPGGQGSGDEACQQQPQQPSQQPHEHDNTSSVTAPTSVPVSAAGSHSRPEQDTLATATSSSWPSSSSPPCQPLSSCRQRRSHPAARQQASA